MKSETKEILGEYLMNTHHSNINGWFNHPRPQFKRNKYHILNGEWQLNNSTVCVPFPPQSSLSGYTDDITEELIYQRTFTIPDNFDSNRILLHFGAVDQISKIYVNDKYVGSNEGGYIPFSFDITDIVSHDTENHLKVIVKDDLSSDYPHGKQSKNPKGMWYTPVSGIWQTVWLENVPDIYVKKIFMDTDLDTVKLTVQLNEVAYKKGNIVSTTIRLSDGTMINSELKYEHCEYQGKITIPNAVNWTPETPYLYDITITAGEDVVESYFALRTINIKNIDGINRVCLNNNPIFLHGVLDQGYFHDGIFLPAHESTYDNDIKLMKDLGFNLLRKHIKIEPDYFYYACDKLGMLIMQDFVNSGIYSFVRDTILPTVGFKKKKEAKLSKDNKRRQIFERQTRLTIEHLYNHPSVIAYTIFNEGWGQFNSDEMYDYVKSLDPGKLVDSTSGWFLQQKSDFDSEHIYFISKKLKVKQRPLFVSECGGFQLPTKGHFFGKKQFGYGICKTKSELTTRIINLYKKMILPDIKNGVCGCIYTQLSDVEDEINGLYTYDREVCKVEKERMIKLAKELAI